MNATVQAKLMDSVEMFIQLFTELTFLFLAISFLVAIINIKLPAEKIQGLLGGKKGRGYLTAAGLGAVTPFCSCSTIPMLVGLLNARAGFGPTMTFLFTSPLLNPIVIALFIPVLGLQVTITYASLALVTSITAGVALQYFKFDRFIKQDLLKKPASGCGSNSCDSNKQEIPKTQCCDSKVPNAQEAACCDNKVTVEPSMWAQAWQEAWSLFRTMFPYMLIAMIIGAAVHGFVPADFFAKVASADNPAAVPSAALIGIPLYMRVTALLPLVGSFIAKGVSIGAVIALVIGSGGASLPEMILLKRLFNWPLMLAFLAVIFSMAVIGGYSFNILFA
ncbi:MAG: permease [Proteobacteria bacterium]|nr:permease [Pseudomonadota bacterium]